MISCTEAVSWIPLYIDNELPADEMALLEAHFTECRECRNHFDQLRSVVDNIRAAAPLYEPSTESITRVRAIVAASARGVFLRRSLAGAALSFCCSLSLLPTCSPAVRPLSSRISPPPHIRDMSMAQSRWML